MFELANSNYIFIALDHFFIIIVQFSDMVDPPNDLKHDIFE